MMRQAAGTPAGGLTKRRAVDLCRVAAMLCRRDG
ncbi:putative leader peptide [Streptomyces sp. DSM 41886]|uniref:Leader peptide n=1 Tax=Streptomyces johnsoniae TaxID=3075532 RepID=A0ABU2RZ76_9ACTN|nr:putative leader peptide [Streptomyces sp. DSM 41886]MDT0442033.1 putative leader peptide [Streptomyces sp. DSM 41886]